ncbi:hypothetical protein UY3_00593 [Chelonia mydas]|uniref:Uncharacterized protein n=1 Tax=Chelonia mydas TaxID=8469 RepID=M7C206_CHEMY|nr:hypothetical protein UY3_00593 [Chelonia mydas]
MASRLLEWVPGLQLFCLPIVSDITTDFFASPQKNDFLMGKQREDTRVVMRPSPHYVSGAQGSQQREPPHKPHSPCTWITPISHLHLDPPSPSPNQLHLAPTLSPLHPYPPAKLYPHHIQIFPCPTEAQPPSPGPPSRVPLPLHPEAPNKALCIQIPPTPRSPTELLASRLPYTEPSQPTPGSPPLSPSTLGS